MKSLADVIGPIVMEVELAVTKRRLLEAYEHARELRAALAEAHIALALQTAANSVANIVAKQPPASAPASRIFPAQAMRGYGMEIGLRSSV